MSESPSVPCGDGDGQPVHQRSSVYFYAGNDASLYGAQIAGRDISSVHDADETSGQSGAGFTITVRGHVYSVRPVGVVVTVVLMVVLLAALVLLVLSGMTHLTWSAR